MRKTFFVIGCIICLTVSADGFVQQNKAGGVSRGCGVEERKRGDMDGNGSITLRDLALLVDFIANCQSGMVNFNDSVLLSGYADMDCDGTLSVADVTALQNVLLEVHEAVDLGLSVKWSTMNIGATSIVDYGDYFAWGETLPKDSYTEENYLYYDDGGYLSIGSDIGGTRYDAAKVQWGDDWRMPTLIDINQLKNKCTWDLVTLDGVSIYRVTGPNGNCIYMPLSGYRLGEKIVYAGSEFYCWSCMKPSAESAAYCLFSQNYIGNWSANRSYGFTIRPVKK